MKITRILKGAGIRSNFGTMGASAVTLIEDESSILVDTGHYGNRNNLKESLSVAEKDVSDIDIVVLTHLNWDHCLNLELFENAKIVIGKKELEEGTLSGSDDKFTEKFREFLATRDLLLIEELKRISRHSTIIPTPGHTAGHISVRVDFNNSLTVISGDAIPNLRAYRRGIPDYIFFDLELARNSVEKIRGMRPNTIIPGHDSPFNDNGYLQNDVIEFILRNENEENTVITYRKSEADYPLR